MCVCFFNFFTPQNSPLGPHPLDLKIFQETLILDSDEENSGFYTLYFFRILSPCAYPPND